MIILHEGFSDKHNGGKTLRFVEFGGKLYIEKPRSSATDISFADFSDTLTALGARHIPFCVRPEANQESDVTLVPYIENIDARDEHDVDQYYLRCGALLALIELLGATDLHSENMIAHGDSPVLVDLETLLAGAMPNRGQYDAGLSDSLIYSHLLPNWMLEDGENRDVGAFTGEGKNLLYYNGKPCPAYEHIAEIQRGFSETYDFFLTHRTEVEKALDLFNRARFRKLLRPTEVYGRLCDRIAQYAPDNPARIQCAERLHRAYERDADPQWTKRMERVCQSEIDAVLRGDIPYFDSFGDERCLRDFKSVVCEDYFALSPVVNAKKRLSMLCETDKRDQLKIIEQSLRAADPCAKSVPVSDPMRVFELMEAHALDTNPCSWIGVDTDDKGRAYLQSIGFDLYNGLLGVLCFYAALYEATGDITIKQTIEKRYAPYRTMYIEKQTPLFARADTINLTHGVGGHILALAYISRCLKNDSYLHYAVLLFERFDFSNFIDLNNTDVYGGISGLLIALPYLLDHNIDEKLQNTAAYLADNLRNHEPTLTGYAHGAAGEALALACAQTVLGDSRYEADILRLLTFENNHFDEQANNWPDLRDPEKHGFMHGLCSGAPGIGLARKRMLDCHISDTVRAICLRDLDRVRMYYQSGLECLKRDSLCCGNAARMEGEKALFGEIQYTKLNAAPVFFHPLDTDDFPAGLFQGWAGVGYALTRQRNSTSRGIFD